MDPESDYSESSSITFEWTLKGLRNLFDSTKGEKKSKVTKSVRFGNNKWQILFYANAGQTKEGTEGSFISLYLSCEPTPEEKEVALAESGRWVREGVYRFSFELRNVAKTIQYNSKEAQNHTFTYKTANWGWAQFARRDSVYYQSMPVKTQDSFVIICTITASPTAPSPQSLPRQPVPKALLDTVGQLLDDPLYSDVQFVIPERGRSTRNARTIWASKRLLQRAEYFQTMFSSNFVEGSVETIDISRTPRTASQSIGSPRTPVQSLIEGFEDSDDEDEELLRSPRSSNNMLVDSSDGMKEFSLLLDSNAANSDKHDTDSQTLSDPQGMSPEVPPTMFESAIVVPSNDAVSAPKAPKLSIEVHDVAYSTYRAMLYYLYTDNVVFAPLSSSLLTGTSEDAMTQMESVPSTPSEGCQVPGMRGFSAQDPSRSRAEWIRTWMAENPGRPAPCSAKSMYRIADRLDLAELKDRAKQHILKSLTVENIAHEIFSPFAATFEAIRKHEVEFFLNHWHDIRASNAMKTVWVQIRNGRHPGFEEVWPLIAQSLEFKPSVTTTSTSTRNHDMAT